MASPYPSDTFQAPAAIDEPVAVGSATSHRQPRSTFLLCHELVARYQALSARPLPWIQRPSLADSETSLFDDELKQSNDRCVHVPHLAGFVDSVPECSYRLMVERLERRPLARVSQVRATPSLEALVHSRHLQSLLLPHESRLLQRVRIRLKTTRHSK